MTDHSQPINETPTSPSVDGETKLVYIKRWRTLVRLPVKYADEIVAALSRSEAPVAWQMRVRGDNGSWFAWDGVDQDEYNLYQKTPTDGAEVRSLYAAPSPAIDPATVEALNPELVATLNNTAAYVLEVRRNVIEECAKIADVQARVPRYTDIQREHSYAAGCIARAIRALAGKDGA